MILHAIIRRNRWLFAHNHRVRTSVAAKTSRYDQQTSAERIADWPENQRRNRVGCLRQRSPPATIAEALEELPSEVVWQLFAHATLAQQADIFRFLPYEQQVEITEGSGRERMSRLIEKMPSDDRVNLLRGLDSHIVENLLPLIAQAERQDIRTLLSYPEGSAGSLMTTEYASVPKDVTAEEAIHLLRRQAPVRETIYYVYVLDPNRVLIGLVTVRQLITARSNTRVSDLMRKDLVRVKVDSDREEAAQSLAKYNLLAIPVVDADDRLVGIVTHDDILDVVQEEATEDVHRMGGVAPMEEQYLEASMLTVWRKRAFWLACLFVAELATFSVMSAYEDSLKQAVILSLFIPLVMSTGGNSGSQAATLICRAMALGQVRTKDWWKVLRHELLMGIMLGLSLGAIAMVRVAVTPHSVLASPVEHKVEPVNLDRTQLLIVLSVSVAIICWWGSLVGSMLPMMFARFGIDPGIASSPFVATFVDVTGIWLYFSIAQIIVPALN